MELYRNTKWHLVGGVLTASLLAVVVLIARDGGPGWAVAFGSIALGIGVELYQAFRKEGTPSVRDAALSAVFGVLTGAGWELL